MKSYAFLATVFSTAVIVALPFVGGPRRTHRPRRRGSIGCRGTHARFGHRCRTVSVRRPGRAALQRKLGRIIEARIVAESKSLTSDWEHLAQKPVPKPLPPVDAAGAASGPTNAALRSRRRDSPAPDSARAARAAPGAVSALGVPGTTSDDLASFAYQYNAIRAENCLEPVSYFVYDSCMEARLFWMAESPSPDPMDALGSHRAPGAHRRRAQRGLRR